MENESVEILVIYILFIYLFLYQWFVFRLITYVDQPTYQQRRIIKNIDPKPFSPAGFNLLWSMFFETRAELWESILLLL